MPILRDAIERLALTPRWIILGEHAKRGKKHLKGFCGTEVFLRDLLLSYFPEEQVRIIPLAHPTQRGFPSSEARRAYFDSIRLAYESLRS